MRGNREGIGEVRERGVGREYGDNISEGVEKTPSEKCGSPIKLCEFFHTKIRIIPALKSQGNISNII